MQPRARPYRLIALVFGVAVGLAGSVACGDHDDTDPATADTVPTADGPDLLVHLRSNASDDDVDAVAGALSGDKGYTGPVADEDDAVQTVHADYRGKTVSVRFFSDATVVQRQSLETFIRTMSGVDRIETR